MSLHPELPHCILNSPTPLGEQGPGEETTPSSQITLHNPKAQHQEPEKGAAEDPHVQQPRRPHLVAVLFPKVKDHRSSFSGGIGCIKNLGPNRGVNSGLWSWGCKRLPKAAVQAPLWTGLLARITAAWATRLPVSGRLHRGHMPCALDRAGAQFMCGQPNTSRTG